MEVKRIRINLNKLDKYVEVQEHFGWEVVDKSDLRPNNTILLTLQREQTEFQDYKGVRSLEKQYSRLDKFFPLALIINLVLGAGFLTAYFVTKDMFIYYFTFMYGALTFFGVSLFALIVYLCMLVRRKKIMDTILKQAAIKAGSDKSWPTKHNIFPENETSWALARYINR